MSNVLQELGPEAVTHRDQLEDVKRQLGIRHDFFDCWIYGFLENKKYDIEETVQKLRRRDTMERNELAGYEITDYMRETMAKGIIQLIGDDKEGRVTFYIVTKRDFPTSKRREENKRNFDMWLSYGTRLRKENKRCRITMLINQKDASMWSNTDMTFQADVALRIAKFYPGAVDRMYICKMSNTLATMAKPIFSRLPAIVSDKIRIFTESDLQKGKLLDLFDENVLPVDLGGKNDCDGPKNWTAFAQTIEQHFVTLKDAVGNRGLNVKEWELETLQKELAESAGGTHKDRREARQLARASRANGSMFVPSTSAAAHGDGIPEQSTGYGSLDLPHDPASAANMHGAYHPEAGGADDDSTELQSCESDDDYYYLEDDDAVALPIAGGSMYGEPEATLSPRGVHIRESVRPNPLANLSPYHRFLLEQERRWRHSLAAEEADRRVALYDRRNDALAVTEEQEEDVFGVGGTRRMASYVPAPARAMLTFFFQSCCVLSAFYFAAATVFTTSIGCSIVVTFFLGMFVDPKFIFPIGIAMLLASFQGALICSRGLELTRLSYHGRMLPGFRYFGSWAQILQLLFTFALILTQFIIFVVYAVKWDTLNGLKVAFATGWLSCTILIGLHHLLYWAQPGDATEWDPSTSKYTARAGKKGGRAPAKGSSGDTGGALPIYLFFDITEEDEEDSPTERTSAVLLVLLPVAVSLLFGAAFLISRILALAVAVPIATLTAAWAVHAYVDGATSRYHAVLTKFVVWFGSIVWQYDCYTFGFRDYSDRWVVPVAVSSAVLGLFMLMSLFNLKKANSSRMFRIVLLMIIGYFVACIIMGFVVVKWSLGVFCLVMALHSGLCVSRGRSGSAITIAGRFLASAGTAMLLIAIVMLGWIGTTHQYSNPRALSGPTPQSSNADLLSYSTFQATPLCGLQLDLLPTTPNNFTRNNAVNPAVTALDAVLLTEVTDAINTNVTFSHDLATWLPNASLRDIKAFPAVVPHDEVPTLDTALYTFATSPSGQTETTNVSILVFGVSSKFHAIRSMAIWTEAIALSPLSIFLPVNWTSKVIDPYSFAADMVPFEFEDAMKEAKTYIADTLVSSVAMYGASHQLYLAGSGVGGGIAQIIGAQMHVMSIGINAPGVSDVIGKYDISREDFAEYCMSVGNSDAALATVGGVYDRSRYQVDCGKDADTCQGISHLATQLLSVCEGAAGRRHG